MQFLPYNNFKLLIIMGLTDSLPSFMFISLVTVDKRDLKC